MESQTELGLPEKNSEVLMSVYWQCVYSHLKTVRFDTLASSS